MKASLMAAQKEPGNLSRLIRLYPGLDGIGLIGSRLAAQHKHVERRIRPPTTKGAERDGKRRRCARREDLTKIRQTRFLGESEDWDGK
jgi:hypothetical protein